MKIILGYWDTRRLNTSITSLLTKRTFYFTSTTADTFLTEFLHNNKQAERVITDDFNFLIKDAYTKDVDYLIVFPSGTIIYDPKSLYQGWLEYLKLDIDLGGHIIDHGAQNPNAENLKGLFGLHEQCIVLSKKLIKQIINDNFIINDNSFYYEDNQWPLITRSEENVHGVYTPIWIKADFSNTINVRKSNESKFCMFYDLIKFTLYHNMNIGNLPSKFRTPRHYSYHLEDTQTFESNLETSLDDIMAKDKSEMPNGQREFFIRWKNMLNPDKGFWAYNTESVHDDIGTKVDCFVAVASGIMPWRYLANFDIQENCKVIFVDVNEHCLAFQKYIIENYFTTTDDFEEIVQGFSKLNPNLQVFGSKDVNQFIDDLPKIKEKWDKIKSLSFEYYKADITSLPESVKNSISHSKNPYVWFSNVFRYIPNLNTIYNDSFMQAYLHELIRLNLNVKWSGAAITNYRTTGPNSVARKEMHFYKLIDHKVPTQAIIKDIQELEKQDLFVKHRSLESVKGITAHRGWSSFVVHGLGYDKTEGYEKYGYTSENLAPYDYTKEAIEYCPNTIKWLNENKFKSHYHRVRIMKLDPGGMVGIHNDNINPDTWATNFAINNPDECEMHFWCRDWKYLGKVPWAPGLVYRIRIGLNHCVINKSDMPRYHIIIHGTGGWI